jgi:hypothetical protein
MLAATLSALLYALLLALPQRANAAAGPADLATALRALRAVGPEGQGNIEASAAWPAAAAVHPDDLTQVLQAMQDAGPLAHNWLRTAFDHAAQQALNHGQSLPQEALESFLRDVSHDPRARWLAFEWLSRLDAPRAQRLLSGLLDDPGAELRRAAVDQLMQRAAQLAAEKHPDQAKAAYSTALQSARDPDQINTLASTLKGLGAPVSLPELFGWISHWQVIGPFDNANRQGFDTPFPPEREANFEAQYPGKTGPVRWQPHTASGDYGVVDLNPPLGMLKEVTGYAAATFFAGDAGPAEVRLGCKNAWKLWFNGTFIFGRDEYHRAMEIDQYRFPIQLRPGPNTLLLKICQNEQVEDWTKEWEFQLRITDPQGKPIPQRGLAERATPHGRP